MFSKSLLQLQNFLQGDGPARHHGVLVVLVVVAVLDVDILIVVVVVCSQKSAQMSK